MKNPISTLLIFLSVCVVAWLALLGFALVCKAEEPKRQITVEIIHPQSKYSEPRKWVIKVFRIVKSRAENQIPNLELKIGKYKSVKMRSSWYHKLEYDKPNSVSFEVDRLLTLFEGYESKNPNSSNLTWFLLPSDAGNTAGGANGVCTITGKKWKGVLFTVGKKWNNYVKVHLNEPSIGSTLHEFAHALGAYHDEQNRDSIMSPNAGLNNRFFDGEFLPVFSGESLRQINNCLMN